MGDLFEQIDVAKSSKWPDTLQTPALTHKTCGTTHKGYIRQYNEDALLSLPEQGLWVVADGMGGHNRGDYASKAVVKALQSYTREDNLTATIESLETRIQEANSDCQEAFHTTKVGSTIAALFEYNKECFFLWAGDSRIYRLRDGHLTQMTVDHSVAQEKFERGELTQDEANTHPSAHILTRAVGVHRSVTPQLHHGTALPKDRYLICSDGLYSGVDHDSIQRLLSEESQEQALTTLIDAALDSGGRDNITVVIVDFEQA